MEQWQHSGHAAARTNFVFQAANFESQTPPPKADRIDFRPVGTACSQNAWPYFETNCLRDTSQAAGQARPVRLVTTDRLPK